MKSKLYFLVSLVVLASMFFSACAPVATPTAAPAATSTTAAAAPTEKPAEPTATTAAAEPTATTAAAEPTATAAPTEAPKSTRTGGWLDKIVFSAIADAEPAVAQIEAGAIDIYPVTGDDAALFEKIKANANLGFANTYGSNDQMILNTVECTDKTKLNPFVSAPIREAMNWALDRNYVVQEIMGGLATPKFTALTTAFADYARYADLMAPIEAKYAYNMDKAKEVVNAEMPKLGAELGSDGKWQYQGKPVVVIGLIRTEDKRKEIGNYFANQLEALGFTVDRQEKTRKEAGPIWQGDPLPCAFNYYTAGWISTAISRDDGNAFAQYNTGKIQSITLFNEFKPSAELAAAEDKLMTNAFSTMDERRSLFATSLDLSMKESWWGVWVIDNIAYYPYKKGLQVASDLAAGAAGSALWPYTIRWDGKEGGEVHIAQSGILVKPWNAINGSNWIDDSMVQRGTMDWGVIANPYTGLQMPKLVQKADIVAEKGLPIGKTLDWVTLTFQDSITVPGDAWADWDAKTQKFITVDEKAKADSTYKPVAKLKSTVYYIPDLFKTTWHDGSNLSVADFVMAMIMTFDQGKKDSAIFDDSTVETVKTYLTHFKGVKIVSTDPLVIETYDDLFGLDAENSVTTWYPSYSYGPGAWHVLAPSIAAEADGKMAFSEPKSIDKKVDQTSWIAGPTLEIEKTYLDKFAADGTLPYAPTMSQFVTADEAKARYANLAKWYTAKKHMWLGTGPYFVDQVFPVEGTITLSRYEPYMFPADQFSGFSEPMIATAAVDGPTSVTIGQEATFTVDVTFKDKPYPAADLDKVSYLLYNAKGDVVATGEAKAGADGQYQIVLDKDATGKLEAGASKILVVVTSKAVSIPTFVTFEFVAQ